MQIEQHGTDAPEPRDAPLVRLTPKKSTDDFDLEPPTGTLLSCGGSSLSISKPPCASVSLCNCAVYEQPLNSGFR